MSNTQLDRQLLSSRTNSRIELQIQEPFIEEGACWDEHWMLYGNQLDNKLYLILKKTQALQN